MSAGRCGCGAAGAGSEGHGWQDMRKERMRAGPLALGRRRVALIDVPDHDLLPAMLPGRPAVAFRAGNELAFQMLVPVAGELAGALGLARARSAAPRAGCCPCSGSPCPEVSEHLL